MFNALKWWKTSLWLLVATVLIPAILSVSVGILILVFYRESWDVAFGVLVLCFAVFAIAGSTITVVMLRRTGRLAQLQAEFISRISHDFRTPLTAIRLFVDTIRGGKIESPEQHRQCLDLLSLETSRMERLVEQVLTWRHVQGPKIGGLSQTALAYDLLEEAVAPLRLDLKHAERIKLSVEPELPQATVDRDAVVEAIRNLIENALKYTKGAVVVSARAQDRGLAFAVRDQGPPIPRRLRKRIFKRFYRAAPSDISGTGLGLSIAMQVAKQHGGSVHLESTPVGNIFSLMLPVVAGPAAVAGPTEVHVSSAIDQVETVDGDGDSRAEQDMSALLEAIRTARPPLDREHLDANTRNPQGPQVEVPQGPRAEAY